MTLRLPDIPLELDTALRQKAAHDHRPMDQVAVDAVRAGLGLPHQPFILGAKSNLAVLIRARFAPYGGRELAEPVRL